MTYATLMLHLELGRSNAALLHIAGDIAERYHAAAIGIAVCQPINMIYSDGYISGDLMQRDRDKIDDEFKLAEAEFRDALQVRARTVEWRSALIFVPTLADYLAREARCADLFLSGTDRNRSFLDQSRCLDMGALVMQIGRPVLIVPADVESPGLERVVIAWKDTRETRRAAFDALPLLKKATHVTVVEITSDKQLDATRARLGDVVAWLDRHGIAAESIASPSSGDDARQLGAIAEEHRADIVVAGAYGHNRVREWVLGGMTRDFLLRSDRFSFVSH